MPRFTPRWQKAALVLAVLGFIAIAVRGNAMGGFINAVIWYGVVYLAFLIVRAIRGGTKRNDDPDGHA